MVCWPACSSPWCFCDGNDTCQPAPVAINALRLRTSDGRFLRNSGGSLIVAGNVAVPGALETFLFVAPAAWPLVSGASISLDVCNTAFSRRASDSLVRVDHNVIHLPHGKKDDRLVTYEVGGAGARVLVSRPFPPGYPAYRGNYAGEWTFDILKIVGGGAAPAGSPINSGDQVSIRINSNRGNTFFFRVTGGANGAEVHGDGTFLGQPGTVFTVEFNEVRSGLGWRPANQDIICRSCAVVMTKVTRASNGNAITGATVVTTVMDSSIPGGSSQFSGTTGIDGKATLTAFILGANRNCIPPGNVILTASANRYQTKSVNATVPSVGNIEVPIQLDCTQVSGRVVDTNGNPVPNAPVYLRDQNNSVINDENGRPYQTTTDANGNFVFNCVEHRWIQVWTPRAPTQTQHTNTIGPEGWTNVRITVQATCGNLVGRVTDANTGQPISGATVTDGNSGRQEVTDNNGCFTFTCLKPAGATQLFVEATGYIAEFENATVPTTGNFDCQNLPPNPVEIRLDPEPPPPAPTIEFQIRLDWGTQPPDLDAHLSGPNPAGGRFHMLYLNQAPVPFAQLSPDITGHSPTPPLNPEIVTIRRSPAGATGAFVAGDYHFWVHDYSNRNNPAATAFVGSNASVKLFKLDTLGNLSQIAQFDLSGAAGNPDHIWHVVDFTLDANGNIAQNVVQAFQAGNATDVL